MQNGESKNSEIILYTTSDGAFKIETTFQDETIWLTQKKMAELFDVDISTVNEHLKNIYKTDELTEKATIGKFPIVQKEGNREIRRTVNFYNLDVIIAVGYRINSKIATKFRQWATVRLREYILKGFTMDDARLKELGGGNYWKELLDRIRDIRSSEKVLYRQVLDLFATSKDYNPKNNDSITFFKVVQNKLHYAAHGNTAAEVIAKRADAGKPFMGLLSFSGADVSKKEIAIAKNYLSVSELKILNNIVSAYFDLAEVKAMNHQPMQMRDWIVQLDRMIETFDKKVLTDAGSMSHSEAIKKAEAQYRKYQAQTLSKVEQAYLENITAAQKKVKIKVRSATAKKGKK